jgi:hypothetical protein
MSYTATSAKLMWQMLPRQINEQLGIGSVTVADRHRFSQSMMIFNKRHEIHDKSLNRHKLCSMTVFKQSMTKKGRHVSPHLL